jgi:hypothetical protein
MGEIEWVKGPSRGCASGPKRPKNGRVFGFGKRVKKFMVNLANGKQVIVEIRVLSKWNRPKVLAWWRANVVDYVEVL